MTNLQKYTTTKILKNLQDTKQVAKEFLAEIIKGGVERNVILLQGELGAGKTTFSQFLLEAIGAEGPFTSPTFVIMKKYEVDKNKKEMSDDKTKTDFHFKNIYHLDCYRVDEEGVLDLGWEEIIADKNNLVLVEWPERIKKIWPKHYWLLRFEYGPSVEKEQIIKVRAV